MRNAVRIAAILTLVLQGLFLGLALIIAVTSIVGYDMESSTASNGYGGLLYLGSLGILLSLPLAILVAIQAGRAGWGWWVAGLVLLMLIALVWPLIWFLLIYNGDVPAPVDYYPLKFWSGYLGALILAWLPLALARRYLRRSQKTAVPPPGIANDRTVD
jgi:hypothetical protein